MGGKKKRHETTSSRSSSLRRETVSTPETSQQTTNVGCMSGVFQFVSKYHTRRKFLTFGKKQERQSSTTRTQPTQNPEYVMCQYNNDKRLSTTEEVTLVAPRSPMIPPEIRKPSTTSFNMPSRPTAGYQMSHNDITKSDATEKRRKLLGALEKCDEDLQELKRIIKAVRGVRTLQPTMTPCRGGRKDGEGGGEGEVVESEEPSPVSVLDQHKLVARSPNMSCSKRTRQDERISYQNHQTQQLTRHACGKRLLGKGNDRAPPFVVTTSLQTPHVTPARHCRSQERRRWSDATRESVIEVCEAVEFGQRVEIGSLVLVIEDFILRDLVYEIIKDLDLYHDFSEAFKRKLSF